MSELKDPKQETLKDIAENLREILGVIFIQEQRNYDFLVMIAEKLGGNADSLIELHRQGRVLAPEPSFVFESED